MYQGSSLWGNYRTRTFSEIFDSYETFIQQWDSLPFKEAVAADSINMELLYYVLMAKYANSHIASLDENRFIFQTFSIIFQYGPYWAKDLKTQKEIRALNLDEFRTGSLNIVNNAMNPSTEPNTLDTVELPFVNNQNVSKTKRSMADGYALMYSLLKEDVTDKFINRFRPLFLTIVAPERPLWFVTDISDEEE